jgi:hypothetical protein
MKKSKIRLNNIDMITSCGSAKKLWSTIFIVNSKFLNPLNQNRFISTSIIKMSINRDSTFASYASKEMPPLGRTLSGNFEAWQTLGAGSKVSADGNIFSKETKKVHIGIPLPTASADFILSNGLEFVVNGMHYKIQLTPIGTTEEIIKHKRQQLEWFRKELAPYLVSKQQIDLRATKFASRVIWGGFTYLLAQSAMIAKLTFFSRFGWDVMEPICYFITFYVGVGGLLFFQFNRIEVTSFGVTFNAN